MLNTEEIEDKADQILDKEKRREGHEEKCVAANICPDCGAELGDFYPYYSDRLYHMGCGKCSDTYQTKKYLFFGPLVTNQHIKYWGSMLEIEGEA